MQPFQTQPFCQTLIPFIHPHSGQGYGTAMASQRLHVQHMYTFCSPFAFLLLSSASDLVLCMYEHTYAMGTTPSKTL